MSSHFTVRLPGQCGGAHNYLSVEEKFTIFTLSPAFGLARSQVLGKARPCRKRSIMRHKGHHRWHL